LDETRAVVHLDRRCTAIGYVALARTQLGESPMNNTATAIILAVGVVIAAGLVGGPSS
jgi:hypothetical protein